MSGYLMRLALRTRATGEMRSLEPFVRSASPIAEHDQRIGIPGFEGFDPGNARPVETGSEADLEQGEVLRSSAPLDITPRGEAGSATVQRKAAPPVATPGSPAGSSIEALPRTNLEGMRSPPTIARQGTHPKEPAAPPSSDVGASGQADLLHDWMPPLGPSTMNHSPSRRPKQTVHKSPLVFPDAEVDPEWPDVSTGDARIEAPSTRRSEADDTGEHLEQQGNGRNRPPHKVSSLRPKPPIRTLDETAGASFEDTETSATRAEESPNLVIGRINVEVVPPPAVPSSTAAPRPLTAAAASVIGPIGGSIHPNLHLSLRHR